MKWIVGLGNPGKRYESTRHNVGFLVVDRFAGRHGYGSFRGKFSALLADRPLDIAGGEKVFVMKPQTYMNLSGGAVREALDYFGGGPSDLVVVHDDLDLPLGRLRYRRDGSAGGHRGVASILESLGTAEFSRLKVGIGREEGRDAAEFVLQAVGGAEMEALEKAAARAAESLEIWIKEGVERAALHYNGPEGGSGRGPGRKD